jgi:copper homeostasis protein (lipoprotein)
MVLFLLAAQVLAGTAGTVSGTATYRERIALPPDAVFEATLEDVSKADASAEVIGQVRLEAPGHPPIHFTIAYESTHIEANRSYAVRGRIWRGAQLMFVTDRSYPILTRGHGSNVELMMRRVGSTEPASGATTGKALGQLPASFSGDLPCADCPGIRYQLNLFPDHVFFLRMTYLGKDESFDDLGTWMVSPDEKTLVLQGGRKASDRFAIKDEATLRKLDLEGHAIASALNYDMKRVASLHLIEPRGSMTGMYRYMADAGIFTECRSCRRMPVAQEQDNAALEAAYTRARHEPGAELLVSLEGRIAMRPKIEGEGVQPTLVVERFINVWPGESCGAQFATANLEDTYWKLRRLGHDTVIVGEKQREPHFTLRSQDHRVGGSGGCNSLLGSYELEGDTLTFSKMATTQMACVEGEDTEKSFLDALEQVKTWKIVGEHLELFDASGTLLARFEARYMK